MSREFQRGLNELRAARVEQNGLLVAAFVFSVFVNILMLTGPLYMLQVYDRVLGSRSEATLVALSALVTFLFVVMGILDHARGRVLARVGARIQQRLERRVFEAALKRLMVAPDDPTALAAQKDVEAVQRFWSSPALVALIDMPWAPLFLVVIFVFNWVLGVMSVIGGIIIVAIAILNQTRTKVPLARATSAGLHADRAGELLKGEAETIRALGMTGAAFDRWQRARGVAVAEGMAASDVGGAYSIISRTFRLFLQSAMLGLGAWLVLHGEMTPGAMIAGSILMGRALQPIEQAVGQWSVVTRARDGYGRLSELLTRVPPEQQRTALPRPKAQVEFSGVTVMPPGEQVPALRMMTFTLPPGQALGVIGPSGAGKSTVARAITNVWRIASGKIRLDGATLDQYDPDVLGGYIGYLPQRVTLFDGTVAENISRLGKPDPAKVVEAAKAAAAHEMILKLPEGYDTRLSSVGGRLSGGQMQRIGLARALYGNPVLLILDEPNSNLDNEGSLAVNAAIRAHKAAGGSAMIMAHRPAAIQECDLLLVVEEGTRRAFGPRDQVLREMVKNSNEINRAATPGGVV
ncbi:type I secretion system permease/ATPase [Paragemmobacter straminiformis]|uniref:Type I secretion system permease/ATPase n=1 Tax=Paragemmobacter straminiformis TaxID=2045119 RepID=A0A842I5W0_9RHOB|nr:type I secretion system permease/ATPase [Gemmobacter straminiformis]MBC2834454.1 type I secretion system permease/ATPase [Gemmobacter straminiformis]